MLLVLEDDAHFRRALVENLRDEGYPVVEAASGDEALALAKECGPFDLVIADVRMAGKDGLDTLADLRAVHPEIRSIVITGYADEDAPGRAIREQVSDYLYKPFRLAVLLESVQRTLNLEQDRSQGHALLAPILAGYRRLMETITTALVNRQLQAVERDRDYSYTSFYVGIRSRALDLLQAAVVWDHLENLEQQRQQLKSGRPDQELCKRLISGYEQCLALITAYQGRSPAALRAQRDNQVELEQFKFFYRRILDGQVPLAVVPIAPFLRTLDRLTLLQSEALRQLYVRCWGAS